MGTGGSENSQARELGLNKRQLLPVVTDTIRPVLTTLTPEMLVKLTDDEFARVKIGKNAGIIDFLRKTFEEY